MSWSTLAMGPELFTAQQLLVGLLCLFVVIAVGWWSQQSKWW